MRRFPPTRALAIALALSLTATACASGGAGGRTNAPAPTPSGPDGLTAEEIEAIYEARTANERTRFTEADVRFMTNMIHHHAQAIEMARLAPERAQAPSIRTLAARIINAQRDEIATMQRWLEARGQPVPQMHVMDDRVMVHTPDEASAHDMHDMPGMLTREQLGELRAASGREFDRLFLTFMIQHHEGAVSVVRELFATDGAGQDEDAFRFASDVQVDQATEVARMKLMLETMRNP